MTHQGEEDEVGDEGIKNEDNNLFNFFKIN